MEKIILLIIILVALAPIHIDLGALWEVSLIPSWEPAQSSESGLVVANIVLLGCICLFIYVFRHRKTFAH